MTKKLKMAEKNEKRKPTFCNPSNFPKFIFVYHSIHYPIYVFFHLIRILCCQFLMVLPSYFSLKEHT